MRRFVVSLMLLSLIAGCSQISKSRFNPTNWLREQEGPPSLIPEESAMRGITKRAYAGTPIHQLAQVKLEPTSDGKILVVTAYGARSAAQNARFEEVSTAPDGELHLILNAEVNPDAPIGTLANREITVPKFLSTGTLADIRKIVVIGETNSLSIRP